jgi:NitT/TauT family transport system ATP-binding protein
VGAVEWHLAAVTAALRSGGATASKLAVEELWVEFDVGGKLVTAVAGVDLAVGEHEFVSLLGPSGCGKTTVLNVVAGFVAPTRGSVSVDGVAVSGPGPDRGVVFQQGALFPWLSLRENIEYGLKVRNVSTAARRARSEELIRLVHLDGAGDKWPYQASGGMQQRVGIARALATDPEVLLMDEPFGALDAQTRASLQHELIELWQRNRKTVLFVTHDIVEALVLSDRVMIMSGAPGRIMAELSIDLERPRARSEPALMAKYEQIAALLGTPS